MKPVILMTDSQLYKDNRVETIHLPFIDLCPLPIQKLRHHYDWLILTSKNAVNIFLKQYPEVTFDRIAVIGRKTESLLQEKGYKVDFVPTKFNQECFIQEMGCRFDGLNVCLPVSSEARPNMFNALKTCANVDRIDLYQPIANHNNIDKAEALITTNQIDWITFMSPSAVKAYQRYHWSEDIQVLAIGHVTSNALQANHIKHVISTQETKESMIETILNIENERKGEL